MKKVLITGAKGFIGKNLVATLKLNKDIDVKTFDVEDNDETLENYLKEVDFIFHLAGINRPKSDEEFTVGNVGLTQKVINKLEELNKNTPILITSSIQAELNNAYGISKKQAEESLIEYSKRNSAKTYIFRLPNVFGKWCRPNYNSVVTTFCNNIANDLEITINDENKELELVYIEDVVKEFISTMEAYVEENEQLEESLEEIVAAKKLDILNQFYHKVPVSFKVTLGEIARKLCEFKESRKNLVVPNLEDEFTKNIYSTYLSYLPVDKFSYPLKMNVDNRGSFTEFIKSSDRGQVSINISKPGITKGNHWHHTKNEKFLVVSGNGIIQFRRIDSEEVIEYKVSGEKLEVVDIPVGYTHNIINTGDSDMVTVMWVNEIFNPEKPDTYFVEV
ncbi:NAD-dependent epimerase/dehydratase family protein [Clostridium sp. UBA4548]|uniref:polysaccharide biosynthesis C-terminal domain-containing protein n=1 Tax=Clostridium sp. UBA4548 TaxID=1946361 RepID=UPI0025BC41D3|nr:NAD-dependent epimerase/dehydratase family protein [Clostridium sp. UBA4548]